MMINSSYEFKSPILNEIAIIFLQIYIEIKKEEEKQKINANYCYIKIN